MVYTFRSSSVVDGEVSGGTYDCDILEPANFDRRKIQFANFAETMVPGAGRIGDACESGFRVRTEYLPRRIRFDDESPAKDFHYIAGLDFVSAQARAAIEQFEPGMHQFEPVEYVRSDGALVEKRFVMFICQRLDSVDRAHTNMILYNSLIWITVEHAMRRYPDIVPPGADVNSPPKKVFSLGQIGDAHMWRDIHIADQQYMSTALVEAIESAGLTGLACLPVASVA
jgi:hypothetical protein